MKKFLLFVILVCIKHADAQIISTVAGNGTQGYSGDGGAAAGAEINFPYGGACDAVGNYYFADNYNNRIRKITPSGTITTVAGDGTMGYAGDGGPAIFAELSSPYDIVFDASGNMYIADEGNNCIRKVTPSGFISTVAGTGTGGFSGDGGQATLANLYNPTSIDIDATGNLYVADFANRRIRMVNTSGIINTIAGNGTIGNTGNGGQATLAELDSPFYIALNATGSLFISDFGNHNIRKVNTSGIINAFAGNGTGGYSGDGGQAIFAELKQPTGITFDGAGNLYIADYGNKRIRKVTTAGVIITIAGNGTSGYAGDGGLATSAELNNPTDVSIDVSDNLFIVDTYNQRIRMVNNVGAIGIKELGIRKMELNIYPNPSSGIVTIQSPTELGTITIYNSLGEIVLQIKSKNTQEQIDVSKLSPGVYTISAQGIYKKIIKE
jgi:trimeric autotransporter adhesin